MLNLISVFIVLICLSVLCVIISNSGAIYFKKAEKEEVVGNKESSKDKVGKIVKPDYRSPFPGTHTHISQNHSWSIKHTGHA